MELPVLVYKSPGAHRCKGGTFDFAQARDSAEYARLIADGWADSPTQAVCGIVKARDGLALKAKALGIKFDGRTSDNKLAQLIEAAQNVMD